MPFAQKFDNEFQFSIGKPIAPAHFFPAWVKAEGLHPDDRFSTCAKKVIKG